MFKRTLLTLFLVATLLLGSVQPASAATSSFYIESVSPGVSVSIRTLNFPMNTQFNVYMGAYGTRGVGGILAHSFNSGDGGVFGVTFWIPSQLASREKIDLRLASEDGYIFYETFTNCTSSSGCGSTSTSEETTTTAIKPAPKMTIYFESVVAKDSVSVRTANFPQDTVFIAKMGKYGTGGIGGIEVSRFSSGDSGIFGVTIPIPEELADVTKLDLRLESVDGDYAAALSFSNISGGKALAPSTSYTAGAGGVYGTGTIVPTISITSVVPNTSVSLQTHNFPASQVFTVRMGPYGSYGINGVIVGTTDSATGGSFPVTYQIPETLKGSEAIAIRLDSPQGYYAFNWFVNQTGGGGSSPVTTAVPSTSGSTGTSPTATPVAPVAPSSYSGYPYFYITAVVQNSTVTISGYNFPPNQTFAVTMGAYGTYGVGGVSIGSTASGAGGTLSATYNIPASLSGSDRIAIRLESPYYYAYNWFYNATAP
jgi:hypothetical protein